MNSLLRLLVCIAGLVLISATWADEVDAQGRSISALYDAMKARMTARSLNQAQVMDTTVANKLWTGSLDSGVELKGMDSSFAKKEKSDIYCSAVRKHTLEDADAERAHRFPVGLSSPRSEAPSQGPDGCECIDLHLGSEHYSGGPLKWCRGCRDVYKSTDLNDCPADYKIISPRKQADWDTLMRLDLIKPLQKPDFLVDVTKAKPPGRWTTADGSPYWIFEPNNDQRLHREQCFLSVNITKQDTIEVRYVNNNCSIHSTDYLCQPVASSVGASDNRFWTGPSWHNATDSTWCNETVHAPTSSRAIMTASLGPYEQCFDEVQLSIRLWQWDDGNSGIPTISIKIADKEITRALDASFAVRSATKVVLEKFKCQPTGKTRLYRDLTITLPWMKRYGKTVQAAIQCVTGNCAFSRFHLLLLPPPLNDDLEAVVDRDVSVCNSFSVFNPVETRRRYSSMSAAQNVTSISMLDMRQAWSPRRGSKVPASLDLDLGNAHWLRGTVLQGCPLRNWWVKTYSIMHSLDGNRWTLVVNLLLKGPTDATTRAEAHFPFLIKARYVRFLPKEFRGGIAMRAGVLSCRLKVLCTVEEVEMATGSRSSHNLIDCPDERSGIWCPKTSKVGEWMQFSFPNVSNLAGVVSPPSGKDPSVLGGRVDNFTFRHSLDGKTWQGPAGTTWSTSGTSSGWAVLPYVAQARHVRILPLNGTFPWRLQASVLLCKAQACRTGSDVRLRHVTLSTPMRTPPGAFDKTVRFDFENITEVTGVVLRADNATAVRYNISFSQEGSNSRRSSWTPLPGSFRANTTAQFPWSFRTRNVSLSLRVSADKVQVQVGLITCEDSEWLPESASEPPEEAAQQIGRRSAYDEADVKAEDWDSGWF